MDALKLLILAATLCANAAAETRLAVAGFDIGQEMTSCPPSSVPMRKGAQSCGIACRFPHKSQVAFGALADQFSMATGETEKIETLLVVGIDAIQAAAAATQEYGAPDEADRREHLWLWVWQRGGAVLAIFHHPQEPSSSNIILYRQPR